MVIGLCVLFHLDCDKLPQHCVLANILRTQLLSDVDFDEIVSLHDQLKTCFDTQHQLRSVDDIVVQSVSGGLVSPEARRHEIWRLSVYPSTRGGV